MFETIAWATDGSELADKALDQVRKLAEIHGSRIVAVYANELFTGPFAGALPYDEEPGVRDKLAEQIDELRADGFDAELKVPTGTQHIATLVERAADEVDADLIVVGTHGRSGFSAALMGSVARELCHSSQRPVLVVPPAGRVKEPSGETERRTPA